MMEAEELRRKTKFFFRSLTTVENFFCAFEHEEGRREGVEKGVWKRFTTNKKLIFRG